MIQVPTKCEICGDVRDTVVSILIDQRPVIICRNCLRKKLDDIGDSEVRKRMYENISNLFREPLSLHEIQCSVIDKEIKFIMEKIDWAVKVDNAQLQDIYASRVEVLEDKRNKIFDETYKELL